MTKFIQTVQPYILFSAYLALFLVLVGAALSVAGPILKMFGFAMRVPSLPVMTVAAYSIAAGVLAMHK